MVHHYILATLIGYFLGCSNLAWYIAKVKNIDLSAKGSGNPGTSNAVILMGWKIGVLVGAHDIGKALLAVVFANLLFPDTAYIAELAGVAAVLGHIFPFYLKFRGGKGFASFIGMSVAINWKYALIIVFVIILVTVLFDYIVIATTVTVVSLPVFLICTGSWIAAAIVCVATAVIILKHKENYVRIYNHTEIGLLSAIKGEHRET